MNAAHKGDALVAVENGARPFRWRHPHGGSRNLLSRADEASGGGASLARTRPTRILLQNHLETCVTEAIQAGGGSAKIAELIDELRFNGSLTDFRERAEPLASPSTDTPK